MKTIKNLLYPIFLGILLFFAISCEKEDVENKTSIPVLTTIEVAEITQTRATSGGVITSDGGTSITERGVCWSTSATPTINDNKTSDGIGAGSFTSTITTLETNTTYYICAYATNSIGTGYGSAITFKTLEEPNTADCDIVFNPNIAYDSFTDPRDSNVYKTVTIGSQVWMAENLKYLPDVDDPATVSKTVAHYYVYDYNGKNVADAKSTAYYCTYGVLYNWEAAKTACPVGWHLPSDTEWTQLTDYLGGASSAGAKLKETGITHWAGLNASATNEAGFTALPGGSCSLGSFSVIDLATYWWGSTESAIIFGVFRYINTGGDEVRANTSTKDFGYSVRCIKD